MRVKIRLRAIVLLCVVMLSFTACSGSASRTSDGDSTLEVHYIDIGQGDASLVICDGEAMLIDAGENDQGTIIQSYLNSQDITSLTYVVGTHPDSDHIGGMDVVLTKFDCENVFLTEEEKDTATYRDVADAIRYKNYKRTAPNPGEQYTLGSAVFTILGPSQLCEDSNDNSIALLLEHGENRFYFEGDASEREEADILETGLDIQADVYKAGHHGSKTSTSDALLAAVNPDFAVISVGEDNSYGHPSAEVLNKFREQQIQVFRTDEQGTIVAVSDGNVITWNTSSSESWQAGEPQSFTGSKKEEKSQEAESKENPVQNPDENMRMVYITESGKKYHAAGCTYLKDSSIEITKEEAQQNGYEPCKKCAP